MESSTQVEWTPKTIRWRPHLRRPIDEIPGVDIEDAGGAPNKETLERLFRDDPYAGLDLAAHPEDMQGWNSYNHVLRDVIETIRPRRIIEVGVWKGTAVIHMAKLTRELGLPCEILAIDTWLGSPEHILHKDDEKRYGSLRVLHGYPRLYFTFLSNVIRNEVADRVVPLPMTSESAPEVLTALDIQADVIHIDAAHQYAPALRDFDAYWPLLSDRGVLIGDDYDVKSGVTRAAQDFATRVDRRITAFRPKFVIAKSRDIEFEIEAR
jgi:predicted O-methyltransferase YrrM